MRAITPALPLLTRFSNANRRRPPRLLRLAGGGARAPPVPDDLGQDAGRPPGSRVRGALRAHRARAAPHARACNLRSDRYRCCAAAVCADRGDSSRYRAPALLLLLLQPPLVPQKINDALDQFKIEKDIATFMKKEFDTNHAGEDGNATWHCVVGKSFGCSITHETKFVLFFECEGSHILLFKSHQ
jgi:hypothetical protein